MDIFNPAPQVELFAISYGESLALKVLISRQASYCFFKVHPWPTKKGYVAKVQYMDEHYRVHRWNIPAHADFNCAFHKDGLYIQVDFGAGFRQMWVKVHRPPEKLEIHRIVNAT